MWILFNPSNYFCISFQSVTQNGANAICLKEIALKTELSALMCKLPIALLNGLPGLNGVPAHSTQLETVYRRGRELLDVVKRLQILQSVSHISAIVSSFRINIH